MKNGDISVLIIVVVIVIIKAFVLFLHFPGPIMVPSVTGASNRPSLLFGVIEFPYFFLGRINPKIPAIV